ncbi:Solute carrier family 12 member 8 [Strongyloides ratti]|uniref:Solute carrier family 12 member 9 n=1 Tax=Strongyloides ratti TaxID=34506 RepID=A0A090LN88_STRRB|nr:Solute carrier family 12 member 8 [Strongyloides ratti]CEF71320.1 Solute carrier family 12 member 8 [Strongyloides ratti]
MNNVKRISNNFIKYLLFRNMNKDVNDRPVDLNISEPEDSLYFANEGIDGRNIPWFQRNFFVSKEKILFGTWDGVFPTVMVNIFGIIIFLRMGWIVGTAGVANSLLLLVICTTLSLITVFSAIGICERCQIKNGGIYFLVSHVLGGQIGGAIGLLYVFGQAVGTSLVAVGFGETTAYFFNSTNPYLIKFFSVAVIVILTVINAAGVRWVIRLQIILLIFLFIAVFDFILGTVFGSKADVGISSLNSKTFNNNREPYYGEFNCTDIGINLHLPGNESFFSVFGVFFANFLGVLAGTNMSNDLREPRRNIALGELSAISVSSFTCLIFILSLGAIVDRQFLLCDSLINEKVSLTGIMFLTGLYLSSLSSIVGSLLGSPRVLQGLAAEDIIPILSPLSEGVGANQNPVKASIVMMVISVIFALLGSLNQLAIMSTMPFLITYAFVNYSYTSLAMSFDLQELNKAERVNNPVYGSIKNDNLSNIFKNENVEIEDIPINGYSTFSNRYVSLFGTIINIAILFFINFWMALIHVAVFLLLHFYIGTVSRCSNPGISQFSLCHLFKTVFEKDKMTSEGHSNFVITSTSLPSHTFQENILTEQNPDYGERKNYHSQEVLER